MRRRTATVTVSCGVSVAPWRGEGRPPVTIPRVEWTPEYSISRVIKGGWQLAGGHGPVGRAQALADMRCFVEAGITTFDCADIYTRVESLIGAFLADRPRDRRGGALSEVQVHTKFVPDLAALATLSEHDVERAIDRSLQRLGVARLDLVQFHWWDFEIPGHVETALVLERLRRDGKIGFIGVTNYDARHLRELVDAGVPIVANQVQYSLLDRRPRGDMTALCREVGIALLCYGTVAGGLLSDRYLNVPPPGPPYENRSLTKYMLIVDEFGGWDRLQELLRVLRRVADRHDVSVPMIATRFVLQQPEVAGAIVGARHVRHLPEMCAVFRFDLTEDDLRVIDEVIEAAPGPLGPVYGLERRKHSVHAKIMHYDLNRKAASTRSSHSSTRDANSLGCS